MNLAFKPNLDAIRKIQESRPAVEVEVELPVKKYRKWSSKEIAVMEKLLIMGVSHRQMAQIIGCGVAALKAAVSNYELAAKCKTQRQLDIARVAEELNVS